MQELVHSFGITWLSYLSKLTKITKLGHFLLFFMILSAECSYISLIQTEPDAGGQSSEAGLLH